MCAYNNDSEQEGWPVPTRSKEEIMVRGTASIDDLEGHLLAKLRQHACHNGLTCGEIAQKCGVAWRRGLAESRKIKNKEARAQDVKDLVYNLWANGMLFVEPPKGRKTTARFWDLESGMAAFPSVSRSEASKKPETGQAVFDSLRIAYDTLASDHLGGYVPIFKVRRALNWPQEKFDQALRDLNERRDPAIELHGGDPQNYSADEIADSFERRGSRYLLMRWRP